LQTLTRLRHTEAPRHRGFQSAHFLGSGILVCAEGGTCPRLYTMKVRRNSITTMPSCLKPVVRTLTMPTLGRDFDSRLSNTSLREYTVSPSNKGFGRRTSSHPRFAITLNERSIVDWPVTSASVNVESTSGLPNSVCAA